MNRLHLEGIRWYPALTTWQNIRSNIRWFLGYFRFHAFWGMPSIYPYLGQINRYEDQRIGPWVGVMTWCSPNLTILTHVRNTMK